MSSFSVSDPTLSRLATADAAMVRAKQGLEAQNTGSKISPKKMEEINAAAEDFESMFIAQMMQPMFETVGSDPLFGGGEGEETWKGMIVEQYGKDLVKSGGLGLSDAIKSAMIQMQENIDAPQVQETPATTGAQQ